MRFFGRHIGEDYSKMLLFDEASHTYELNGKKLKSVSHLVSSQFKRFNPYLVSSHLANSKAQDQDSQYFGMDQKQIMQMWADNNKSARDAGTALHRDIECFYKYGTVPNEESPEWKQFLQFNLDHPDWVNIGCEMRVHNNKVAGTIDAVFDTPDGIVLVDWKRCKTIDYSGYGQGRDLMKHVPDCNYSKYGLQLSLYRQLIKTEVSDCFIIQLHPDQESYKKIKTQNFHVEAQKLIA